MKALLAHPLTRGMDLDDPRTTHLRRRIVREKAFLNCLYREWYEFFRSQLPAGPGRVLEIGSGAGFLPEILPDVITSELFPVADVALVLDAQELPFGEGTLRAVTAP